MNPYQSCANIKAAARERMFGHYGTAIGAGLLVLLSTNLVELAALSLAGAPTTVIGTCLYYAVSFLVSVLTGLFVSGMSYFYLKNACGHRITVGDVFQGFRSFPDKALAIQAWISLISYLFDLPRFLLSPRITLHPEKKLLVFFLLSMALSCAVTVILDLFYAQAFFLLHDFPQYSGKELLAMSRKLMSGHKGRLLRLYISFIPLVLVSVFSCGIAMLWVMPYMNAALAEFYLDVVRKPDYK